MQLWAWNENLDLGHEVEGSLNLSPAITEKSRFSAEAGRGGGSPARTVTGLQRRGRMSRFVLKRMGFAVITLFSVLTIVFFIVRILPGDPALVILGDQASQAAIESLRARLGLDEPLVMQYFEFIGGVLTGDWGTSLVSGRPVIGEILKVLPATIELTVAALILGVVFGIPLGVWSAIRRNSCRTTSSASPRCSGCRFPPSSRRSCSCWRSRSTLRWFPVMSSGAGDSLLARGCGTLRCRRSTSGLIMAAYITRVSRSAMLEVLGQDYVRTAQGQGHQPSARSSGGTACATR